MNEITVLIYFICFDRVKNVHPELRDIKPGEELLVFQVKEDKD